MCTLTELSNAARQGVYLACCLFLYSKYRLLGSAPFVFPVWFSQIRSGSVPFNQKHHSLPDILATSGKKLLHIYKQGDLGVMATSPNLTDCILLKGAFLTSKFEKYLRWALTSQETMGRRRHSLHSEAVAAGFWLRRWLSTICRLFFTLFHELLIARTSLACLKASRHAFPNETQISAVLWTVQMQVL
ncbi:hypothetical protein BD289DRAFT_434024 [Coniella lustricola]|uniref:Uncharacterized protein n=1 Tax=Coniella lustricola TaxID=2025994 RepID=A0A2T3A7W8_9PEZI|nr:hypothetical protein BD289DRAFT_434024 [Coniella lustricola]